MSNDPDKTNENSQGQFFSEELAWYKQSYLLLLASAGLLGIRFPLLFLIAFIWGLVNIRNDRWYKFLWPWLILLVVFMAAILSGAPRGYHS
jgi:hypothetical protein